MDRIVLNPLSAVRLLLISGIFVVIWIIFGAGSAHAAELLSTSNGSSQSQPAATGGLLPVLTTPLTPLVTAVQPKVDPAPATMPAKGTSPASVSAAPLPASVLGTLSSVAPAVIDQATAPVVTLADATVTPITAPVTELVTDTIRPVSILPGSVLSMVPLLENSPIGVSVPPSTSPPGSAGALTNAEAWSPLGDPTPAAAHGATAHSATQGPAGSTHDEAVSVADDGRPLQYPLPIPGRSDPFSLPSPLSGGTGSQGQARASQPTPAAHPAAADLSHRFVLPLARGGEGSLFSFSLPGSPEQEPVFSPD